MRLKLALERSAAAGIELRDVARGTARGRSRFYERDFGKF
jgi:hypothetical protein